MCKTGKTNKRKEGGFYVMGRVLTDEQQLIMQTVRQLIMYNKLRKLKKA